MKSWPVRLVAREPAHYHMDPGILACVVVTTLLAIFVVILRFYVRWCLVKKVRAEDWCILASVFMVVGTSIAIGRQTYWGLGKHLDSVPTQHLTYYYQAEWWACLAYNLSLVLTKVSILLFYLRTFESYPKLRYTAWALFILVISMTCVVFAVMITACVPLRKYWDPATQGHCQPQGVWWVITGFNALSDLCIFVLPLPIVYRLQLPRQQKLSLVVVFTVGSLVCLMSILRFVWIQKTNHGQDFTYDNVAIAEWSCVELGTAILCASLMTLKPVYNKLFPMKPSSGPRIGQYEPPQTVGSLRLRRVSNPFHTVRSSMPGVGPVAGRNYQALGASADTLLYSSAGCVVSHTAHHTMAPSFPSKAFIVEGKAELSGGNWSKSWARATIEHKAW